MTPESFCYWLNGLFELSEDKVESLNPQQTNTIRQHLALVFVHMDSVENAVKAEQLGLTPQQVAEELQKTHDGPRPRPKRRPGPDGIVYRC